MSLLKTPEFLVLNHLRQLTRGKDQVTGKKLTIRSQDLKKLQRSMNTSLQENQKKIKVLLRLQKVMKLLKKKLLSNQILITTMKLADLRS